MGAARGNYYAASICTALEIVMSLTKGPVKWFDPKKGYGFIVGPENQDVFVHYSHIESDGFRSLKDGEIVEYELVEGDKGWQARSVKATGEGGPPPESAGGGGGGKSRGSGGGQRKRSGGGGQRKESASDMLVDKPRRSQPADNPPRDVQPGGYEAPAEGGGYEGGGYESADSDPADTPDEVG